MLHVALEHFSTNSVDSDHERVVIKIVVFYLFCVCYFTLTIIIIIIHASVLYFMFKNKINYCNYLTSKDICGNNLWWNHIDVFVRWLFKRFRSVSLWLDDEHMSCAPIGFRTVQRNQVPAPRTAPALSHAHCTSRERLFGVSMALISEFHDKIMLEFPGFLFRGVHIEVADLITIGNQISTGIITL